MIQRMSHTTIYVTDQERAKKFYTETLGFEVKADHKMDGGFWWLTVAPKGQDLEIVLMPLKESPLMDAATVKTLRELVAKGAMGTGVLEVADCRAAYERLKAAGVEFMQPPAERFYGIEALFKDDSGNWFSMCERPRK